MSDKQLRVGIIGADTKASWVGASHVSAIQAQPGLILVALHRYV
jgi:predicted dehydrogenase